MNAAIDPRLLPRELAGWAVRGILCAAPSAFWAVLSGFKGPAALAAMAAGTAAWIAGFAWFSLQADMQVTAGRKQFVRALKMAAWIKALPTAAAAVGWISASGSRAPLGTWLAVGILPDVWAGFSSVWLVGKFAGVGGGPDIGQLNSFGRTLAITLVQGGLISVLVAMLACGVLGGRRLWSRLRPIFPARIAG